MADAMLDMRLKVQVRMEQGEPLRRAQFSS